LLTGAWQQWQRSLMRGSNASQRMAFSLKVHRKRHTVNGVP
jgi:hypothetical protein